MNVLRIVLLALAAVMFVALGWRLTGLPLDQAVKSGAGVPKPAMVAANPPAPATPKVEAPKAPAVPAEPATPVQPAAPAAPSPALTSPHPTPAPAAPSPPPSPPAATGEAMPPAIAPGMTAEAARKAIEAQMQTAPDLARVFAVMTTEFPAVADRSMKAAVEALRRTGTLPTPDDFVAAAMRDARLSAGVLAARAGPEALAAIFDAKAATLSDLEAADPRICADYVYGGTSPEFNDFAVTHRALVARTDIATLTAMADGRTRQMTWDTPSPEDYALIEAALKTRGLSPDEVGAVLDGKSLDTPPSDTRVCDNARAYLDAMRTMPPDARNRVYGLAAELLARS